MNRRKTRREGKDAEIWFSASPHNLLWGEIFRAIYCLFGIRELCCGNQLPVNSRAEINFGARHKRKEHARFFS